MYILSRVIRWCTVICQYLRMKEKWRGRRENELLFWRRLVCSPNTVCTLNSAGNLFSGKSKQIFAVRNFQVNIVRFRQSRRTVRTLNHKFAYYNGKHARRQVVGWPVFFISRWTQELTRFTLGLICRRLITGKNKLILIFAVPVKKRNYGFPVLNFLRSHIS